MKLSNDPKLATWYVFKSLLKVAVSKVDLKEATFLLEMAYRWGRAGKARHALDEATKILEQTEQQWKARVQSHYGKR